MIRRNMLAAFALATAAAALAAQGTKQGKAPSAAPAAIAIPAVAVGTWDGKSMIGPKDSVVATSSMTIAADGKVSLTLTGRPTMQARVLAAGGDSVSIEVGPYESVVKKGLQATTHMTQHFNGNAANGTFDAKYSDGSTLKGKGVATRKAESAKAPTKKP